MAGTRDVLVAAVERQMMGDVPVGVFLSGGLDSSLVAAAAARVAARRGRRLQTFAVGTVDSPDLAAAREVAAFLGTDHHERTYTAQEALAALPEVVRAIESFDPGLVRSAVPNFLLAEMTARHVKVVLTGEGADELFAGYDYLREFSAAEDLHAELERTVRSLHNLNLQRCDRVTMAHGLEARVPFLDAEVIRWALRLPPEAKLTGPDRPGEGAAARGVRRLAARPPAVAHEGGVRRRLRRARRALAGGRGGRSPTPTFAAERDAVAAAAAHARRSSPTTASGGRTSARCRAERTLSRFATRLSDRMLRRRACASSRTRLASRPRSPTRTGCGARAHGAPGHARGAGVRPLDGVHVARAGRPVVLCSLVTPDRQFFKSQCGLPAP